MLDKTVGDAFQKVCSISTDMGDDVFIMYPKTNAFMNIGPLDDYGINVNDMLTLEEAGLIRSIEGLPIEYLDPTEKVDIGGLSVKFNLKGKSLTIVHFTKSGTELRKLLDLKPNQKYLEALKDKFKDQIEF